MEHGHDRDTVAPMSSIQIIRRCGSCDTGGGRVATHRWQTAVMRWPRRQVGTHPGHRDVGRSCVSLSSGCEVLEIINEDNCSQEERRKSKY
uniref:Uncharacterized protein n=1 Tax=Oryza glumipatula TaxID=40148 RepID=A0A0E0AB26_9ORYZ